MSPERHDSMPSVPKRPGAHPLPQPTRPDSDVHEHDLVDAAWLYAGPTKPCAQSPSA